MSNYRHRCEDCEVPATTPVCKSCAADRRHQQWRHELIVAIREYYEEHGVVPAGRDFPPRIRSRARLAFGSWSRAVEVAGFTPYKAGGCKPLPVSVGAPNRIPLTSDKEIVGWAKVDPSDRPSLVGRRWFRGSDGYAYGSGRDGGSNEAMHRVILDVPRGHHLEVDHINGDRLDNRRSNLRLVTRAQNLENRTVPATGRSRFRGVAWSSKARKWTAKGTRNNRTVYIGIFAAELDAARAAQEWRNEHMPFAQPDPELEKANA